MRVVGRTDLLVGLFLLGSAAAVVLALVTTSGWGVDRYGLFIRTDDATDVAIDTKIYMRGFEVGRVARIEPRPAATPAGIEFIIHASVLRKYPNDSLLTLPRGTEAQVLTGLLGGATLQLVVRDRIPGSLEPGDTITMTRHAAAMEAFGALATDLKGTIQEALEATTLTLISVRHLADSLTIATGTARRFVAAIQPETQKTLSEAAATMQRLALVLDSTNARGGTTLRELNATIVQSRRLMASADSLTRLLVRMGGENRPEIRQIMVNARHLTEQLQYVMEQLGRRPMRFVTGVSIPDSLTVEGRARRDSTTRRPPSRDTANPEPRP